MALVREPTPTGPGDGAADGARQVMVRAGTSFGPAFRFLDPPRRQALDAVYAFCRMVDDAVDDAPDEQAARAGLTEWRERLDRAANGQPGGEAGAAGDVERALAIALATFPIRRDDLAAVIEGCEWDLVHRRYASWDELRGYCLRVASAVGLACIEIFGHRGPRARDYAVDLGLALQLTNILRDVDEDAARGRIYLPLDELASFGVSEGELLAGRRSEARRRLMAFQEQRARLHFVRARAALSPEDRRSLLPAEIMGDLYEATLDAVARAGFPPRRVSLSKPRKALVALRSFVRSRLPA